MNDKKFTVKVFCLLHIFLLINSLFATASKFAAQEQFLSYRFVLFYGIALANMAVYAVVWQQLLKYMQLTTAYSNKAVCMIWTVLWGWLLFEENISIWKIVGVVIIIMGVILVVSDDS